MIFNSVDEAYAKLAAYMLAFIGDRKWQTAGCSMRIFNKMATASQWLKFDNQEDTLGGFEKDSDAIWDGLDAALYLRDILLQVKGDRIWGLTFTLHPDGKFKIEYDYEKPADYVGDDEAGA